MLLKMHRKPTCDSLVASFVALMSVLHCFYCVEANKYGESVS